MNSSRPLSQVISELTGHQVITVENSNPDWPARIQELLAIWETWESPTIWQGSGLADQWHAFSTAQNLLADLSVYYQDNCPGWARKLVKVHEAMLLCYPSDYCYHRRQFIHKIKKALKQAQRQPPRLPGIREYNLPLERVERWREEFDGKENSYRKSVFVDDYHWLQMPSRLYDPTPQIDPVSWDTLELARHRFTKDLEAFSILRDRYGDEQPSWVDSLLELCMLEAQGIPYACLDGSDALRSIVSRYRPVFASILAQAKGKQLATGTISASEVNQRLAQCHDAHAKFCDKYQDRIKMQEYRNTLNATTQLADQKTYVDYETGTVALA